MARIPLTIDQVNATRYVLNVESVGLTPEQFFHLCGDNPELRLELTARKEIIVMSPANSRTGMRNAEITRQLGNWARQDGRGVFFDSNTGFVLPNGATRSPDASWILRSRWNVLTPRQQSVFAPICPDFVIELWSPSDALNEIRFKLEEYVANGAKLGFLIYPPDRQVYVYSPDQTPQLLDNPESISGDPELPGFTLDLTEIWE
ncbi:MAG TPA: Uma2 family endonuclease [Terriglobia bacterium]